jgi:hypothetical protein
VQTTSLPPEIVQQIPQLQTFHYTLMPGYVIVADPRNQTVMELISVPSTTGTARARRNRTVPVRDDNLACCAIARRAHPRVRRGRRGRDVLGLTIPLTLLANADEVIGMIGGACRIWVKRVDLAISALRPLIPRKRRNSRHRRTSRKCHVWTAPSWQKLSSRKQHWSGQPCVRPVGAVSHDRWPYHIRT